jgi:hypothetical protein
MVALSALRTSHLPLKGISLLLTSTTTLPKPNNIFVSVSVNTAVRFTCIFVATKYTNIPVRHGGVTTA